MNQYPNIDDLPKRTLESGQVLVEIEPNIWVDYETYKPKPEVTEDATVQ
jgi:hypothetical protein